MPAAKATPGAPASGTTVAAAAGDGTQAAAGAKQISAGGDASIGSIASVLQQLVEALNTLVAALGTIGGGKTGPPGTHNPGRQLPDGGALAPGARKP